MAGGQPDALLAPDKVWEIRLYGSYTGNGRKEKYRVRGAYAVILRLEARTAVHIGFILGRLLSTG